MRLHAALLGVCLVASTAMLPTLISRAAGADACGIPSAKCQTAHGFYRLALPPGSEGGEVPAVVFLHGWGGTSDGVMQNSAMLATLAARGYALIAPEGVPRPGSGNRNWSVRDGSTYDRNDIAFVEEVIDDAARHGVDRTRILLAGFSRGASMVWDIACHAPATARAYAPVAGAFWDPMPTSCEGPVDLFHTHGWTDRTVPLEGRSVDHGMLTQGDVFAALKLIRDTDGCDPEMPDSAPMEATGDLWFRHWGHCPGGTIDLMLHPGGHMVPKDWTARALDWFEGLDGAPG